MKKLSLLTVVLVLIFAMASVATAQVKVQYWHYLSGINAAIHEAKVAEFNALHPDIQVEVLYTGNQFATRDKLMVAVAGGQPPHVALMDQFWPPLMVSTGALVPIKEFVDTASYFADYTPVSLDTVTIDGQQWTMPFSMSNQILFYNKDLFREVGLDPEKPPTTWDELVEYGKLLTRDVDGYGQTDQWGVNFTTRANIGSVYNFITFLWQAGGEIYNEDFTATAFNDEAAVEAVNFWIDLAHKHKILTLSPPQEGFEVGRIAMQYSSTSSIAQTAEKVDFDFGVAALPAHKKMVTGVGGSSMGIFRTTPEQEAAAWTFVEWMSSEENNLEWSMTTGYTPLRKSVINSAEYQEYLAKNPYIQTAIAQSQYAKARPNQESYADVSRVLGIAVEEALYANTNPQRTLNNAVLEANGYIF